EFKEVHAVITDPDDDETLNKPLLQQIGRWVNEILLHCGGLEGDNYELQTKVAELEAQLAARPSDSQLAAQPSTTEVEVDDHAYDEAVIAQQQAAAADPYAGELDLDPAAPHGGSDEDVPVAVAQPIPEETPAENVCERCADLEQQLAERAEM